MIDKIKLKINTFSTELEAELDPTKRTIITTEVDIYETAVQDNNDGTINQIYRAKVVGATTCKQGGVTVKGKSKRPQSKKLRMCFYGVNPSEEYYQQRMSKIIDNFDKVNAYLDTL